MCPQKVSLSLVLVYGKRLREVIDGCKVLVELLVIGATGDIVFLVCRLQENGR